MPETIKLTDEAQRELKGLIEEKTQEIEKSLRTEMEAKAAAQAEAQAKELEALPALKAKLDDLQGKMITLKQKTGTNTYVFKGYNPELSKNFKTTVSPEASEVIAKAYLSMIKDKGAGDFISHLDKAFDGSDAIGVQYGSALMGLAERQSVALTYADVIVAEDPIVNLPAKATRDAVDSVTPGTANTTSTSTLGQITWTIDKVVGNYVDVLTTQIADAKFDIINQFIIPLQAEAVGQNFDDEMFNGTQYTSSVGDATASVTASGSVAIAAAVTFDNLNTMYNALSWDRGITDPMWFGPQAVYKDVMGLVGTTSGDPVFLPNLIGVPVKQVFGSTFIVTPAFANAPADGAGRLAFGDPRHYRIFIRGSQFESMVNPYILMKERYTQFIASSRSDGNISDHATPASTGAWTVMKRVD